MGGKQTRKGKCLLFYTACSLALVVGIWGCTDLPLKWKRQGGATGGDTSLAKGEGHLVRARTLLARGEYKSSLREAKEVLRVYPRTLGEDALVHMGLIYAYPYNPDRDYQRSLTYFQRLINEFPVSEAKRQAQVWVVLLQEVIDKDIIFQQEIVNKDRKIGELNEKSSHLEMVLKKKEKRINELESWAKRLESQVEGLVAKTEKLQDQLLRLKEIDLGIEEKKSEASPALKGGGSA